MIACSGGWTRSAEGRGRHGGDRRLGAARGWPYAGDFDDLSLVERFALEQRTRQAIERITLLAQQPHAVGVALLQDPLDLTVDHLGGRFAIRFGVAEPAVRIAPEERVLAWRQRHRAELVTHAPARDHLPR